MIWHQKTCTQKAPQFEKNQYQGSYNAHKWALNGRFQHVNLAVLRVFKSRSADQLYLLDYPLDEGVCPIFHDDAALNTLPGPAQYFRSR